MDSHKPKQVAFNKRLVNVPTFEMEYHDFAPLKRTMKAIFVEAWYCYTKKVTDNLITQHQQKYITEKLATAATKEAQMDIDFKTTYYRYHIQDLIKKETLEKTKNILQELYSLKDSINTMKNQQQQHHKSETKKWKNQKTKNMLKEKC